MNGHYTKMLRIEEERGGGEGRRGEEEMGGERRRGEERCSLSESDCRCS